MRKAISPVFFVLAAVCFFLPFFSISCTQQFGDLGDLGGLPGAEQGQADLEQIEERTTVTGFEVATGAAEDQLNQQSEQPPGGTEQIPGLPSPAQTTFDLGTVQIVAIAVLAVALIGLILGLLPRVGGIIGIILAVLGIVGLLVLNLMYKGAVEDALGAQATQFFDVNTKVGLWLSLVSFALAALAGVWMVLMARRRSVGLAGMGAETGFGAPTASPPGAPPPAAPPPGGLPPAVPPPTEPPPTRPEDETR